MAIPEKPIGLIVPHTHWDREWRYPIWRTRSLLVQFMDQLLELLACTPEYRSFVLDGQTVIVDDYLEMRPERTAEVKRYVAEGRLAIGPWYTLPDLYPLDGECLVRNLLKGTRVAQRYGRYLPIGYNSFGWGQIAQFPQIYQGFGIDFIIAAKRVAAERAPYSEFLWEAPDGTRVLTTRLGKTARHNTFVHAYIPARYGVDCWGDDFRFAWGQRGQLAYHNADAARVSQDYFRIDTDVAYHPDRLKDGMEVAWHDTDITQYPEVRLLMNGCDFTSPQPIVAQMIDDANRLFDERSFRFGTLEEYADLLKQQLDKDTLPVVKGEMRDGPACHCSANALSTRIRLKQLNKRAQNLLLRQAEPMATALALLGEAYPTTFFNAAWTHLLQAHPHDSINGVTQDKTADDTRYRLQQAIELGEVLYDDAIAALMRRLDLSACADTDILLLVVNPLPYPVRAIRKVCIDTPCEQGVWAFSLTDAAGQPLGVQHVSRQQALVPVHDLEARPWPFQVDRHMAYIETGEIPAGGYTVLQVVPEQYFKRDVAFWPPMRTTDGLEIASSARTLENSYLKVEAQADGTLIVTEKTTGRVYRDLLEFEDTGDIGDYWAYYPPYQNQTFSSRGGQVRIWLTDNGPLAATLVVESRLTVPAYGHRPERGIEGESRRSDETTELLITSRVTLTRDSRRVDVHTEVDNTARDHRLRVLFPTDIAAEFSQAAGLFTVDTRPIMRPAAGQTFEPEMQTLPQQTFVDVSNGTEGLAVVNNCLTEYEIKGESRSTLALTLFRSVRNYICTELRVAGSFPEQQGGQSLGTLEFDYAIYPHQGDWVCGEVYQQADAVNVPLSVYQLTPAAHGNLPLTMSCFSIEPSPLVLSAMKKAEERESFIVRLYNPSNEAIDGAMQFGIPIEQAYRTDLNEERQERLTVEDGRTVRFTAGAQKIVTCEIVP